MAYLATRSISFGSYARPARQVRRRHVRFAGHYGLGDAASTFCNTAAAQLPLLPGLSAPWLQACITAYHQQHPTPPPAAPAPPIAPAPSYGSAALPASYYAGTPVPVGFPITQIYVQPNGNQWMFDQSSGTWKNATLAAQQAAITSEQAQAAQIAAATATSPGGPESPTLVTSPTVSPYLPNQPSLSPVSVSVSPSSSGYSDILNWLSESTLISPVPNWILLAGAGLVFMKLSGKGGHLL